MKLTFLGAAGTVTGSKYLLESEGRKILIDCGLYQGLKELRLRNWADLPVNPRKIDTVVLTHAHIDHSGYLPLLVKSGFEGPVYCTEDTADLCAILLPDSGYLNEKDAEYANRMGFSKHKPAKPLYTAEDARVSLERFKPKPFGHAIKLGNGITAEFLHAGHILGAAMVRITYGGGRTILFSGDLGRPNSATMPPPDWVAGVDALVVESTYGDRLHELTDPEDALAAIITATAQRGGSVLVPSFAVGRAQALMYHIHRLKQDKRIPDLPVFLDSPMAIKASDLFCAPGAEHGLSDSQARAACAVVRYTAAVEDSKALNANTVPKVIISASGMATGGRVLHHIKHLAPDPRNTILFAGFQAPGTRGEAMVNGAKAVKIHGRMVEINAQVANLEMMSAHADANEIMGWLKGFRRAPDITYITHGEPAASVALQDRIQAELNWTAVIAEHMQTVTIG